jgi:hypothetical protein
MKAVCAWCERDGRPTFLGDRAPLDDAAITHGICNRHMEELLAQLTSRSFPGVRILLVVNHTETKLYDYLSRRIAGVNAAKVIMERRRGERRRKDQGMPVEQRQAERRLRHTDMSPLGYAVIRFGLRPTGSAPHR